MQRDVEVDETIRRAKLVGILVIKRGECVLRSESFCCCCFCKLAAHYRFRSLPKGSQQVRRRIRISVCNGWGDKTVRRGEYARELFLEQKGSSVSCRKLTFVRGSRGIGIS